MADLAARISNFILKPHTDFASIILVALAFYIVRLASRSTAPMYNMCLIFFRQTIDQRLKSFQRAAGLESFARVHPNRFIAKGLRV
ncbi:hypothetical protein DFH06DRAFT_1351643 [Mycena polygramma]|nr:hypothetical protein DFH06DRAFT_1351638 [Mycena polygramma]KAJ7602141.1 hypothetical protein DFH06DRAFT_1351643 [Mycena polygramma]